MVDQRYLCPEEHPFELVSVTKHEFAASNASYCCTDCDQHSTKYDFLGIANSWKQFSQPRIQWNIRVQYRVC